MSAQKVIHDTLDAVPASNRPVTIVNGEHATRILDALKAAGWVLVELPEPARELEGRHLAIWDVGDHDHVRVDVFRHIAYDGMQFEIAEARDLAAALLAAVNAAEKQVAE